MSQHRYDVRVTLSASGVEPTSVPGHLEEFPFPRRLLRAGLVILVAIGASLILIPIPIIHLVGIPLVWIVGITMAVRTVGAVARLDPTHLSCPKCGARNNVGGGMGYRTATGPVNRLCESCRRPLELRFER